MSSYLKDLLSRHTKPATSQPSSPNNNWVMVENFENSEKPSTSRKASNKANKTHTKKITNVQERIAKANRKSRRNTNNESARIWRNRFNTRVDRIVKKIETLKEQNVTEAYKQAFNSFLSQLERIQDNIETYNIKNQPMLKKSWDEFLDNMDINVEILKNIIKQHTKYFSKLYCLCFYLIFLIKPHSVNSVCRDLNGKHPRYRGLAVHVVPVPVAIVSQLLHRRSSFGAVRNIRTFLLAHGY